MDRSAAVLRYPRSVTQIYGETGQPEVSWDTLRQQGRHSLVEPPFVGRAREFRQLMQLLGAASRSHGQVVMISGPAGIGKTRLAEEVALRARRRGVRVAVGRCWRDGEAPPLWPWHMVLRDLDAPGDLLAAHIADTAHGRFARFVAVLDYLRHRPPTTSYLLVLDDAHVADPATLLLARFLARERRGLRLLLLLTCRDDLKDVSVEGRELLTELERDTTPLRLAGLSEKAVRAYLSAYDRREVSPGLSHTVSTITQGNPLHLRSVVGRGTFRVETVLGGLEQEIARIIAQLAEPDQRLLGYAALLGVDVSVHEVARVAETEPSVTAAALARAEALSIMTAGSGDRLRFVHERVRDAALTALTLPERLDAHARAATLWTGPEPERLLCRAHHAFIAASRSMADAITAVHTAREAAAALQMVDGFEPAAALLGQAVELHKAAALPGPVATLEVAWAEAVLACGRLAEARPLFHRAAHVAEAEGDVVACARAALGLGGVWVREHRLLAEAERVAALQRRALDGLPPESTVLRTRLTICLAAEEAYRNGPLLPVIEGVDAARRTGDARRLAVALSLCHHVLLNPAHTWRRLAMANELVTAAATAGDGMLALIGLCWRAADLFLLGEPTAEAALAELRLRADALQCRSILFIVRAIEIMLTIRAGQFAQAEEAASACFALGNEVGDVDALAYYGAHLVAIRTFQGREAELADLAASIATSPTLIERECAFGCAAALFALRAGRPQQAQALLERLKRDGLETIPPSSSWLLAILAVVELAATLDDNNMAQAAYDTLLPYAELPIMASLAVVCFGSVHRALGVAALTCGKLDLAVTHLQAAVAASTRLGHRPAALQARAELGIAYVQRGEAGDAQRGRAFLQEAMADANTLGMTGLVARWQDALAQVERTSVAGESHLVSVAPAPHGGWRVALGAHVATTPDLVGMRYLARLVAVPNQDISALALVVDQESAPAVPGHQEVLDACAMTALRRRICELRQEPVLSVDEQEELDMLTHELALASGLGGRSRSFTDVPERARTAVRKALKRAIAQITAANPVIGQHLEKGIETGTICRYRVQGSGR
jgi:tetratricopeptide (TPR) repeat protein